MHPIPRFFILAATAWFGISALQAAPSPTASPTVAASGTAASTPTPIPWDDVATQAALTLDTLQKIEKEVESDQTAADAGDALRKLTGEITANESEAAKLLEGEPSLETLRDQEKWWHKRSDELAHWKVELSRRSALLDKDTAQVEQFDKLWKETKKLAEPTPKSSFPGVAPEVSARINAILGTVEKARQEIERRDRTEQTAIQELQNRVGEQALTASAIIASLDRAQLKAVSRRLAKHSAPIWRVGWNRPSNESRVSFSDQWENIRDYAEGNPERFLVHAGLFGVLLAFLYWARRRVEPWTGEEPSVQRAALIFDFPISTALVLSVLARVWIYPGAPELFRSILGAIALVPTVLILRRLVEEPLFPILNALVAYYFVDLLRKVAESEPVLARWLLLGEMAGGMLFVVWLVWSGRAKTLKTLAIGARAAFAVFAISFLANVFGYVSLAEVLDSAVLGSSCLAVILYAATRIADGLIMVALSVYPLAMLRMVKRHRYLFWSRTRRVVQAGAFLWWAMRTLDILSIRAPLVESVSETLAYKVPVGHLDFSLENFLAFGISVWAAFLISRFCRFALEEDVYPRVHLARGLPYAISTMLHYVILVIGFYIAAGASGIDMTKFTIVAGAFGVGLGFGLQNIINNFVSGLILLFERPVKVGDVIQLGDLSGVVDRIGIRASVVRTGSGSEIIVPNGMLISEQVTNWTFSNRQRGIDIPIGVAYGTDPGRVIALLTKIAEAHPLVTDSPAPVALFSAFGASALEFVLHAWTNHFDQWTQIRSDLGIAINAAFAKEGIEMPYPQQDLHLRSVAPEILKSYEGGDHGGRQK